MSRFLLFAPWLHVTRRPRNMSCRFGPACAPHEWVNRQERHGSDHGHPDLSVHEIPHGPRKEHLPSPPVSESSGDFEAVGRVHMDSRTYQPALLVAMSSGNDESCCTGLGIEGIGNVRLEQGC